MSEVRSTSGKDADHAARPDVSLGLWTSESGIPADPPATPVSSGSVGCAGWSSNLIPLLIPKVIPRMNPQRKTPYVQVIFRFATRRAIYERGVESFLRGLCSPTYLFGDKWVPAARTARCDERASSHYRLVFHW